MTLNLTVKLFRMMSTSWVTIGCVATSCTDLGLFILIQEKLKMGDMSRFLNLQFEIRQLTRKSHHSIHQLHRSASLGGNFGSKFRQNHGTLHMKINLQIADKETYDITFSWNQFFGMVKIYVDGNLVLRSKALCLSELSQLYDYRRQWIQGLSQKIQVIAHMDRCAHRAVDVRQTEKHHLDFIKERTIVVVVFRGHKYFVMLDGKLVKTIWDCPFAIRALCNINMTMSIMKIVKSWFSGHICNC